MRCRWYSRFSFYSILISIYVLILILYIPQSFFLMKLFTNKWKFQGNYRGPSQRVITLSMFGPKENPLFQSNVSSAWLYEFIQDALEIYPGWRIRIYHDDSVDVAYVNQLQSQYDIIDLYNMIGESSPPARMWRFLSIGDASVDIMLSRDLDSPLTHRERSAVDEWISSDKIMHIMRDHPLHYDRILAGMWGFRPAKNRTIANLIYTKLQNESLMKNYQGKGDQQFLLNELWPLIRADSIIHDSFHCQRFPDDTRAFPTRRPSVIGRNIFIGCVKPCSQDQFTFGPCPFACRPPNHKDWIYC